MPRRRAARGVMDQISAWPLSPSTHSSPLTDGRDNHDLTADDFATALRVLRAAPTLAEDDADLRALKRASRNDRPSAWAARPETSGGASERMEMEIGGLALERVGDAPHAPPGTCREGRSRPARAGTHC